MNVVRLLIDVIPVAGVVFQYYFWKREFALPITDRKFKKLKSKRLIRFTFYQANDIVYFEKKVPKDSSTGKRPVVYFFVGEPSGYRRLINNITSSEARYSLSIDRLDKESVLYRQKDGVVAYLKDYEGEVESKNKIERQDSKLPKNFVLYGSSLMKMFVSMAVFILMFVSLQVVLDLMSLTILWVSIALSFGFPIMFLIWFDKVYKVNAN